MRRCPLMSISMALRTEAAEVNPTRLLPDLDVEVNVRQGFNLVVGFRFGLPALGTDAGDKFRRLPA